jgi:hypothetical protein
MINYLIALLLILIAVGLIALLVYGLNESFGSDE